MPRQKAVEHKTSPDLLSQFTKALSPSKPWEGDIVAWATHPSFCGLKLYPRQATLLKLMFLETENFTQFDYDTIGNWAKGFRRKNKPMGVQEDIFERIEYLKSHGYTRFPEIQLVMGRRASKGFLGGILIAERMGHLLSLDNFQAHYGIAEGKAAHASIVATSQTQAQQYLFADVRQTVEGNAWLSPHIVDSKEYRIAIQTPSDLRRLARLQAEGIPAEHEVASIVATAMSSNSSAGRGATAYCAAFDEFAHFLTTGGGRSDEQVYGAYTPSLDQFGRDSLILTPSSPWSRATYFHTLYKNGTVLLPPGYGRDKEKKVTIDDADILEEMEEFEKGLYANPEMLVVQLPSWDPYLDWERGPELVGFEFKGPIQYEPLMNGVPENERMFRLKTRDPARFKVEREAQFAEVMAAYLDPQKVDAMFAPFWGGRVLEEQETGQIGFAYHGHADPSKTNANFAVAIGHLEQSPERDHGVECPASKDPDAECKGDAFCTNWSHVIIDYMKVYQPKDYEDHTVDYLQITSEIEGLLSKYRSLEVFSFDQFNSAGAIATLKQKASLLGLPVKIKEETFTGASTLKLAEQFKAALNLGWVHAYRDKFFNDGEASLLETEAKFLSEKNGRVVKQDTGPCTTKDLFDAVSVVTTRLLTNQLENHSARLQGLAPSLGLMGGYPRTMRTPYSEQGAGDPRELLSALSGAGRRQENTMRTRGRVSPLNRPPGRSW